MLKNKKILGLISIILVIVIAGLVILFTKGMNYGLAYGNNTTVELYLETDFEIRDVQNIIIEVFGNDVKIKQVNSLEKDILIITKTASDEQLNNLISKINDKYGLKLEASDLLVTNNVKLSGVDLVEPYILPVCITLVGIILYSIIRYRKLGIYNISLITIITVVLAQLLVLSIYAIARLPINEYTMPISMMVYIISVICITEKFEKDLKQLKEEEQ